MERSKILLFAVVSAFLLFLGVFASSPIQAAPDTRPPCTGPYDNNGAWPSGGVFGRCYAMGYFGNAYGPSSYGSGTTTVLSNGLWVDNVDQFVSRIKSHLGGSTQNRTGAAFIIKTMLGKNGPGGGKGVSGAELAKWETLVRTYNSNGLVSWSTSVYYPKNTINSRYNKSRQDNNFYLTNRSETQSTIIFRDTNGSVLFKIKKNCGNPIGALRGLKDIIVNWSYQARMSPASSSPAPSEKVIPGQAIGVAGNVVSAAAGSGIAYNLQISPSRNAAWVDTTSPLASGGFWTGTGSKTARWNNMPALGGSQSGPVRTALYALNSNAEDGELVCFISRVSPSSGQSSPSLTTTSGSSHSSSEMCYTIEASAKYPFLEVHGADVWAGGIFADQANWTSLSACSSGTAVGPKHIVATAPTNYGSIGEIGVLATGDIRNFGSTGDVGSDILSFSNEGATPGSYFDDGRCLTNFYRLFESEPQTKFFNGTNIAAIYNTDGQRKTNIAGGQSLALSGGPISRGVQQIILVRGDVTISGNIRYANYSTRSREDIPLFVLVALGDINILDNVTRLDGLYVAIPRNLNNPKNGVIRTCSNAPAGITDTDCTKKLTINGVFIAQDVEFNRTSGDIDNGGPAEIFEFSPEMYLAETDFTSRFFGNYSVDQFKDLPPVY